MVRRSLGTYKEDDAKAKRPGEDTQGPSTRVGLRGGPRQAPLPSAPGLCVLQSCESAEPCGRRLSAPLTPALSILRLGFQRARGWALAACPSLCTRRARPAGALGSERAHSLRRARRQGLSWEESQSRELRGPDLGCNSLLPSRTLLP